MVLAPSPAGWNQLDFLVVCVGFLEFTSFGNYTVIRCFRVLRPLRAITKIEALRVGGAGCFSADGGMSIKCHTNTQIVGMVVRKG